MVKGLSLSCFDWTHGISENLSALVLAQELKYVNEQHCVVVVSCVVPPGLNHNHIS